MRSCLGVISRRSRESIFFFLVYSFISFKKTSSCSSSEAQGLLLGLFFIILRKIGFRYFEYFRGKSGVGTFTIISQSWGRFFIWQGCSNVASSQIRQPRAQMSALLSQGFPSTIQGLRLQGEPTTVNAFSRVLASSLAPPKEPSLTSPWWLRQILWGEMRRWMTFLLWTYSNAMSICMTQDSTNFSESCSLRSFLFLRQQSRSPSSQNSKITMKSFSSRKTSWYLMIWGFLSSLSILTSWRMLSWDLSEHSQILVFLAILYADVEISFTRYSLNSSVGLVDRTSSSSKVYLQLGIAVSFIASISELYFKYYAWIIFMHQFRSFLGDPAGHDRRHLGLELQVMVDISEASVLLLPVHSYIDSEGSPTDPPQQDGRYGVVYYLGGGESGVQCDLNILDIMAEFLFFHWGCSDEKLPLICLVVLVCDIAGVSNQQLIDDLLFDIGHLLLQLVRILTCHFCLQHFVVHHFLSRELTTAEGTRLQIGQLCELLQAYPTENMAALTQPHRPIEHRQAN